MNIKKPLRLLFCITTFASTLVLPAKAQNIVASGVSVMTVEKMVRDYLFNGNKDVTIKNIKYTGGFGAVGAYKAVGTPFGTTEGMILSTGSIYMANGPYMHDTVSTVWGSVPDFDAERLANGGTMPFPPPDPPQPPKTQDAAVLEFDISTPGNGLTFNFQFGSYEYDDSLHTDTSITIARDFFAILVQGTGLGNGWEYINLGTVTEIPPPPPPPAEPSGPIEVPINSWSVNNGPNNTGPCLRCDKFFDNRTKTGGAYPFTSMPGFTGVFTKSINIIPCDTYHVKILITDVEHPFIDSHLFLNIETVNPPVYEVVDKYKIGTASFPVDTVAYEDCDYAEIRIERYTNIGAIGSVNLTYTGTAIPGVDYKALPATVNFAPGQRVAIVPLYAKKTGPNTPPRTVIVNNANEICGVLKYFSKAYYLKKEILNFTLGPDTNLCEGQQIMLNASNNPPAEYYVWQDAKSGPTYNVTKTGKYSVRARIGTCLRSDTINVNFKPLVKFTLGPDSSICYKDSLKLDPKLSLADTAIKYLWFDMSNKPTKTVGTTGNYHLRVTRDGCSTYDTMSLTVKPLPSVSLANDTAFCYMGTPGYTIIPNTDPFNGFLWSTGSTNFTLNVQSSGTYWLRATSNGCHNFDTMKVAMTQTPPLNLRDTSLCENYALKLSAPGGFSYIWNNGSTDSSITVYKAGTFIVRANNAGCIAFDTSIVTRKASPVVDLGNDTALCKGQAIILDATSPDPVTYKWGGAGNGCGTLSQCAAYSTGNYIVTLTSQANGCISKDTLYFLSKPLPDPKLGKDTSICYFTPVTLIAQGPYDSLMWFDGSTGASYTYDKPGDYWVKAYNNNCSNIDTVHVKLSPLSPPLTLSKDTGFCKGSAIIYDVSCIGCTYLWDDNYTLPIRTFKKGGEHIVTISNLSCSRKDTISIDEIIPASVFPKDTFMCFGQVLTLINPIPGAQSRWFDNTIGNTKNVNSGGKYWLRINNKGCQYTDTIQVNYVGDPIVDLGPDISTCSSEKLILDATNNGNTTYMWSNGSTSPTLVVEGSGIIRVDVTRCGVTATDEINVDYLSREMTFYVPNAFTPDNNALNEQLIPRGKIKEPFNYRFSIYNKWGQKVFESNDFSKGWDGTMNGNKLPSDVYVWTIEAYSDCYAEPYYQGEGNVTLLK